VHDTPLPPVPSSKPEDIDQPADINIDKIPLGGSRADIAQAIQPDSPTASATTKNSQHNIQGRTEHKHIARMIRFFRGATKGVVDAKFGSDHIRAKAGSEKTKDCVGVFIKPEDLTYAEPDRFKARFEGKSGWVYIIEGAAPRLLFSIQTPDHNGRSNKIDPIFEIPVGDISMLKRSAASVKKPLEKAVEWSSSNKELLTSLEFEDRFGQSRRFTALLERDELFNRLVAIGDQHWENM
jgi:hypothetical protein